MRSKAGYARSCGRCAAFLASSESSLQILPPPGDSPAFVAYTAVTSKGERNHNHRRHSVGRTLAQLTNQDPFSTLPNYGGDARAIEEASEAFEACKRECARLYPDFEATMASASECIVLPYMVYFIKTAPGGARVAYHLVKNRPLLAAISALDIADAFVELWRLEAKLTPVPAAWPWCEPWWLECFLEPIKPTATPEEKRGTADLARLNAWNPDTQPH
jgi:hypothetical protein